MYINNTININAKIKPKEIFFLKLRLFLNRAEYGFLTGMSILGLIYYIDLFLRNDIRSINIIQEISSHFPGSVIALAFPVAIGSTIINIYSKTKKELKDIEYMYINYFFSDFGISFTWKEEKNISWNRIAKIKETSKYYYIYTSRNSVLLVPKRDFSNNDNIISLNTLLREKLPGKKLSLKS
ncbi:MAG TPA: YcxB family protein [Clostridiaceae bacterium]|nr:YcxB family protein [Clostridiaceae bacterium]